MHPRRRRARAVACEANLRTTGEPHDPRHARHRAEHLPEIVYDDAPAALAWLAWAFGFSKGEVIEGPDGTIAHAEMHLGPGTIMPKPPMAEPEFRMKSPRALAGINQCLYVAVEDPDAHYERARAAGAEIVMEPFDTD
jgi:uncharacterized glyoxalase superfamily protein PhnB